MNWQNVYENALGGFMGGVALTGAITITSYAWKNRPKPKPKTIPEKPFNSLPIALGMILMGVGAAVLAFVIYPNDGEHATWPMTECVMMYIAYAAPYGFITVFEWRRTDLAKATKWLMVIGYVVSLLGFAAMGYVGALERSTDPPHLMTTK